MEAHPPTYGQATAVNAWDLIAGYISSSDLCAAALVCRSWHAVFIPHLWGNPASHFGDENDRVYVALTRFKRTLPWARLVVRSLTHTLHLPPAHAEIYNGPSSDWIREVLEGLPNLQSLIVRGLPFFDHAALDALKFTRPNGRSRSLIPAQTPFGLRLLDASRCSNVTSSGLYTALRRFDSLLYLDLSWTYPAKHPQVLRTLGQFYGLQVLKLRGINLRDEDVETLAKAIETRVRSLDVRNNQLTDRSVRMLLHHCFTSPPQRGNDGQVMSPSLLPYLGEEMLSTYRGEHFEAYLRNTFTAKFVSRLAIEDAPESGITHLYISDNQLTVEGLSGLLRSGRLHVLDAGTVEPGFVAHSPTAEEKAMDIPFPGTEKLTPVLAGAASRSLTYLRIDHCLITKEPPNATEDETLPGLTELADTSGMPIGEAELDSGDRGVPELDGSDQVYELPGDSIACHELPADCVHIVVSPAETLDKPKESTQHATADSKIRRSSLDAPEPVIGAPEDCSLHVVSIEKANDDENNKTSTPKTLTPTTTTPNLPFRGRPRSYSSIVSERQTRVKTHISQSKGFHPGILPHLTTLVLTSVPSASVTSMPSDRLISFIRACAEESVLARLQAKLDWTQPPGRHLRHTTGPKRTSVSETFALQNLVLEIAAEKPVGKNGGRGLSAWRQQGTKSVTQDRDSEGFWSAAESDFSFFGEEEEVSSLGSMVGGGRLPLGMMGGMEVVSSFDTSTLRGSTAATASEKFGYGVGRGDGAQGPQVDVIGEVSRFRKSRRQARDERVGKGETDPEVDGFWEGNIRVVRGGGIDPRREDDEVWADYYGNRFSNGYLYR